MSPDAAVAGQAVEISRESDARRPARGVFAFLCGLHFAILQFGYFFLMEAYLSSQALAYFVALFFWLCGFLLGLWLPRERWLPRLLLLGVVTYYVTWVLTRQLPFHPLLYPSAALCSIVSGLAPGYFFPDQARRFAPARMLLFHENNGFILGILVALKAAIHRGAWFLGVGPLLSGALVGGCLVVLVVLDRRARSS